MAEDESKPTKTTERIHDPSPDRYRYLADLFYRFANNKVSLSDIARIPRKSLQRLAEVAFLKYKYGRLEDAKEIFRGLARVDHTNYYYRSALGGIYQKLKKWVDAVANYTMALALNPTDVTSLVNRGEVYLRHEKYKKAAEDFRSAILLDRAGKNLWSNRGRSLVIALKRSLEAKKALQAAKPPTGPRASRSSRKV